MLVLYLVAAAAVVIWGGVVLRRSGLFGGCLAVMLLACCFGYEFHRIDVGPLPLTSDRVALVALTGFYLLSRVRHQSAWPRFDWVDATFALFLAILAINVLTHDWRYNGAQPVARLVFLYIAPAALYLVVRDAELNERRVRLLCGSLGAFSLYLAATAIAEVNQISAFVFPRYILSSDFREWLGRARGPFLNPATNGIYLSAGLFALSTFWPRARSLGKTILAAAMGLVLIGIYYTLTRSCWLGAVAGLGFIILASVPPRFRLSLAAMGLVVAGLVLALKGSDFASFKRDKDVSEYHMAQSAQLRPMLAVVAWKIAKDYPLFGCGLGQYKRVDVHYLHDPNVGMPLEKLKPFVQHNVFLSLLTETGFVGLSLYLLLLGGWLHHGWRLWRASQSSLEVRQYGLVFTAFILVWVANGMFHDTSLMVNANLLFFTLAGVSQGLSARAFSRDRRASSIRAGDRATQSGWYRAARVS